MSNKIITEFPNYEISETGVIFNSESKRPLKASFYNSK